MARATAHRRIRASYVKNCVFISPRMGQSPLFNGPEFIVRLDGYVIIPRELYEEKTGETFGVWP